MSVEVLGKLFYEMGETVSKYRMQELFDKFDADGNGSVDLKEFTMGTCQVAPHSFIASRCVAVSDLSASCCPACCPSLAECLLLPGLLLLM